MKYRVKYGTNTIFKYVCTNKVLNHKEVILGRKRNTALRNEQDQYTMITNKQNQIMNQRYQKQKENNTITFVGGKQRKRVELVPKTQNQEEYILALTDADTDIVITTGPAGTGKTYLAVLAAISELRNGAIERIVLTRPAVGVDDEKHGFLPGDLNAKMEPWTRPLLDVLREYYTVKEVQYMLEEQIIEIAPLAFMRGRTFKNSWIILDEAQNATPSQIKMLLTRIGSGSKIVVTGDIEQTDRRKADNGLMDLGERLAKNSVDKIKLCKFGLSDVQRHPIIESIIRLYNQ